MATPPDLGILLGMAYQVFTDELRADLHERGFTDLGSAYGYVFRALADRALHLNELARQLGMTDQGASKIINEMEARGYVKRRPDPHDGRAKELILAPRGRTALTAARRFHAAYERRLRTRHGDQWVTVLRRMLDAMIAVGGASDSALRAL